MRAGIIGYGSMGKMLLWKFAESGAVSRNDLFVANRTQEKLGEAKDIATVCGSNGELARNSDIVFVCVRPGDLKGVIEEIGADLRSDALLVSLNGSISFNAIGSLVRHKTAKVIPSVTAEVNKSQTLVCYNDMVADTDKVNLKKLLCVMGNVIELPENEMGMGSELVSCMPGFIASLFDVVIQSAKKHTGIPYEQAVNMLLNTVCATGELMLKNTMTFSDVVTRVATKGGITEEGTKVVYDMFPAVADKLFEKTLEKRSLVAEKANESFCGNKK